MAKQNSGSSQNTADQAASDLAAIKQLLILALVRDGVKQSHIASALGVGEATISRMFPKGLLKSLKRESND